MNAKRLFSALAAALAVALALAAAALPEEKAMAQTPAYDVSGIYITTYYSPVESYHPRSCLKTISGWVNKTPSSGVELSGSKVELGTYPCRFVNQVANEGSGKRTNLSTGPSSASSMTALNYSTEGMPGGGGGYWLDTCPRNSFGGCLQPMRSSAASSSLVNGGDMRPYVAGQQPGTEYVLKECGTDPFNSDQPMNSTTCDWYKDGGSPWLVDDEFSTGLVDTSTKQIDLYYGFEDRDNIQNTDYIMDFKNAVATVTGEEPAPDTPQEPPPPPPDTSITSASTASSMNSTTAAFGFSSNDFAATFECKLDGAAFEGCASPKEYSGLAEGQHTFEVRAKNAGGTDDTPASKTWTVDTTAPPVPVFTSPADGRIVADGNITFSGTAEANGAVELFEGADSKGTATVDDSGGWSKSLTSVTEGSHTYTARAKDAAGNTSDPSATLTVDVQMPPQVISVSPAGQAQNVAPSTNVAATFSEAMNPSTLTTGSFTLAKQGDTAAVTAAVSYDAATKKATLDPGSDLAVNTTYAVTITTGAKDAAGNALAQDHSWTFTTAAPSCTKRGTSFSDTISGTSGKDVICGLGGNDTLKGLGGDDLLLGGDGNDTLVGGTGNDSLDGGPGTDTGSYAPSLRAVDASLATNTATGEGSDTFVALENLLGSSYADTLTGSDANNALTGGSGSDTARAGAGDDKVVGSGGTDSLFGEGGNDSVDSRDGVNGNDYLDGGSGTDAKVTDTTEKSIMGFP